MSTVKKVNQYKCDFCGKKNYSKGAMNKHEKHCTKNPDRHCQICDKLSGAQHDLNYLKTLIPDPLYLKNDDNEFDTSFVEGIVNIDAINDGINKVLEETEGCPNCTLAVLRQKNIIVPMVEFNYKKQLSDAWSIIIEEDFKSGMNYC